MDEKNYIEYMCMMAGLNFQFHEDMELVDPDYSSSTTTETICVTNASPTGRWASFSRSERRTTTKRQNVTEPNEHQQIIRQVLLNSGAFQSYDF